MKNIDKNIKTQTIFAVHQDCKKDLGLKVDLESHRLGGITVETAGKMIEELKQRTDNFRLISPELRKEYVDNYIGKLNNCRDKLANGIKNRPCIFKDGNSKSVLAQMNESIKILKTISIPNENELQKNLINEGGKDQFENHKDFLLQFKISDFNSSWKEVKEDSNKKIDSNKSLALQDNVIVIGARVPQEDISLEDALKCAILKEKFSDFLKNRLKDVEVKIFPFGGMGLTCLFKNSQDNSALVFKIDDPKVVCNATNVLRNNGIPAPLTTAFKIPEDSTEMIKDKITQALHKQPPEGNYYFGDPEDIVKNKFTNALKSFDNSCIIMSMIEGKSLMQHKADSLEPFTIPQLKKIVEVCAKTIIMDAALGIQDRFFNTEGGPEIVINEGGFVLNKKENGGIDIGVVDNSPNNLIGVNKQYISAPIVMKDKIGNLAGDLVDALFSENVDGRRLLPKGYFDDKKPLKNELIEIARSGIIQQYKHVVLKPGFQIEYVQMALSKLLPDDMG